MECIFCGKDTMNKTNNQVMCKSHYEDAKKARDEHNTGVKEALGPEKYAVAEMLATFNPNGLMTNLIKTTAGYHLNKMYKEIEKEKVDQPNPRF